MTLHERLDVHHETGQAKFLTTPLHGKTDAYLEEIAKRVITEDGSDLSKAMEDVASDLASEAADLCPKDLTILSRSDHVTVTSDGATVYDRPPEAERLSEEESDRVHGIGPRRGNIIRQSKEQKEAGRGKGRRINPPG